MQKTFILILILALTSISLFAKSDEVYFKFQIENRAEIDQITKIISIDNVQNKIVFAYANSTELEKFQTMGYNYTLLPHPNSLIEVAMTDEVSKTWTAYPTYEAYVSAMYQFAIDYPTICTVQNIGNSIGGREILFAKISDNITTEEDEPEFMYTGQMHGDETVTYIMLLNLIEYLLTNYGSDTQVDSLINNVEIWINPLSNPDGTYAGGNSTVTGATRNNSNGVDLNRNYPDPEDGQNPDGNSWQAETVVMMDFADAHSFVLSSNLHNGEEVVNYPWDTWSQLHADDDWYQYVSHLYADAAQANSPAGYIDGFDDGITNGYAWYSISGGRQDYMNYFKGCRELTLELSLVKMLPENELENHWNYNRQSLLEYMEHCLYGIRGIVTDELDAPVNATIEVVGHDINNSQVFTDPDIGDYHRMLSPGTYDLKFSCTGYDDITVTDVEVTNNTSTAIVNVQFGVSEITQSFSLNSGWDLISLNVHPTDMSPASVFSPISADLAQVKNLTESYDPSLPAYMNTLDTLVDGDGYWINLNAVANLDVTAEAIDVNNTTINLNNGWNLAGYPCQSSQDVAIATSDISAYLVQVKNLTESYDPSLPAYMNTLSDMNANLGYWFNVDQNCSFNYPTPAKADNPIVQNREFPENWVPVIYPNNSATLYAKIVTDSQLSSDDVLAAFNGDKCRGTANIIEYEQQYFVTMLIQLSEPNELINFKFFNESSDQIIDCSEEINTTFGEIIGNFPDDLFEINSILLTHQDDSVTPVNSAILHQNYPNPFNPETTISFETTNLHELARIEIFNIKGQQIRELRITNCELGINKVVWSGNDQSGKTMPSGVYFYRLSVDDKLVSYKKMILMK
ncbi:MAG: carboxypeptidase regulatory-like domain-containing protein [Candidatus Cloacimonetes bacterium]|nr:carboxypeptidase regulatory-like domain-containing protein [Candidatus Cloacimonadota bacterium]